MAHSFLISRRKAALAIAGTFAGSAAPAAASLQTHTNDHAVAGGRKAIDDSHRQIIALLRDVRRARGTSARRAAFEHCSAALRRHDLLAASRGPSADEISLKPVASLYRSVDSSLVLAKVIARELASWPPTDAGWIERFGDLEAAFQAHVAEHDEARHAHGDRLTWASHVM